MRPARGRPITAAKRRFFIMVWFYAFNNTGFMPKTDKP